MNNKSKFYEIKQEVQELIKTHEHKEITAVTKYKVSGIYMIYLDHFVDDKFVPIYIGQSKDIQKRYKAHYTELLALNRISYDEYKHYFFSKSSSFYEGKFKTSKIFKYMVENNCTLEDFHMIVLEDVESANLIRKEEEYFEQYLPSFFGFNQLNSLLKRIKLFHKRESLLNEDVRAYCDGILRDIQHIHNYINYGYTKFNFEHSLVKDVYIRGKEMGSLDRDTTLKVKETEAALLDIWKEYLPTWKKMNELAEKRRENFEMHQTGSEKFRELVIQLKKVVDKKFAELNFNSLKAKDNFIYSILDVENSQYEKDFLKFMKSKQNQINFYNLYQRQIKEIKEKQKYKNEKDEAYKFFSKQYTKLSDKKRKERYKLIFPGKKYNSFVLQDKQIPYSFMKSEEYHLRNTCEIRFIIGNNGLTRGEIRKDPYIIRIDYRYIDEELKKNEKKYYIDNEITQSAKLGFRYIEQDFYNLFTFNRERFKVTSVNKEKMDNTFISALAEYKHGVSDYTIKGKELVSLLTVLTEIEQQTNMETKFKIVSTESFPCLEDCMRVSMVHENPFVQNIMNKKLPKIRKIPNKSKNKKIMKIKSKKTVISKVDKFKQKIKERSNNEITALTYTSSKEKVLAKCNYCNYEWESRSDHLLARPYCPKCKKQKNL